MSNGKGDTRRPAVIDPRQLEINWDQTFNTDPVSFNSYRSPEEYQRIFTTVRDNPDQDIPYGENRRFNRR